MATILRLRSCQSIVGSCHFELAVRLEEILYVSNLGRCSVVMVAVAEMCIFKSSIVLSYQGDQMEWMKMAKKPLKMPIYCIKWFKMVTSGHPVCYNLT